MQSFTLDVARLMAEHFETADDFLVRARTRSFIAFTMVGGCVAVVAGLLWGAVEMAPPPPASSYW